MPAGPADGVPSTRCSPRCPAAAAAHLVNNGAAALALVATALAGGGREIVIARGELVEIGDGFRIPELLEATGARLREVGTTNRVAPADYAAAIGPDTAFVLKVHPSNFVVTGFTRSVEIDELAELDELAGLGVPVVADIGSGLLAPHPLLPDEPDASTALRRGATLVTASGDKLLGGPQAGLLLGAPGAGAELVARLRRHPLARALRVDKLTLAAMEATLRGPATPVRQALDAAPAALHARATRLAETLRRHGVPAEAVAAEATVGGGGAPGVTLPSAAVALPEPFAAALRAGDAGGAGPARTAAAACSTCAPCPRTPTTRWPPPSWRAGSRIMQVVATAGHVDHGKSTLVRALTGMEPDRWAEERRRGMTIDLGFAWTTLPSGAEVAFVDVPGHERFVTTMLAGVGPVPGGAARRRRRRGLDAAVGRARRRARRRSASATACSWSPAATCSSPELAREEAREHLAGTPLAGVPCRVRLRRHRRGPGRPARRARRSRRRPARARPARGRAAVGGPGVHDPRGGHRGHRHARPRAGSGWTTSSSC